MYRSSSEYSGFQLRLKIRSDVAGKLWLVKRDGRSLWPT